MSQRMIQHRSMLQCAVVPTQHVSCMQRTHYVTLCSKCPSKMWIFTILKLYFHHKNMRRFLIHLGRLVLWLWSFGPITSKVKSPLKIIKLLSFQNPCPCAIDTVFNGFYSLLHKLRIYKIPADNACRSGIDTASVYACTHLETKLQIIFLSTSGMGWLCDLWPILVHCTQTNKSMMFTKYLTTLDPVTYRVSQ